MTYLFLNLTSWRQHFNKSSILLNFRYVRTYTNKINHLDARTFLDNERT